MASMFYERRLTYDHREGYENINRLHSNNNLVIIIHNNLRKIKSIAAYFLRVSPYFLIEIIISTGFGENEHVSCGHIIDT
jgi:hypothetical protein